MEVSSEIVSPLPNFLFNASDMTFPKSLLLLALFSIPALASAGAAITTSSFQATFVVNESCAVVASAGARPAVACQLSSPYQVQQNLAPSVGAGGIANIANIPGVWTVTF